VALEGSRGGNYPFICKESSAVTSFSVIGYVYSFGSWIFKHNLTGKRGNNGKWAWMNSAKMLRLLPPACPISHTGKRNLGPQYSQCSFLIWYIGCIPHFD
jgi:hypothetical protein